MSNMAKPRVTILWTNELLVASKLLRAAMVALHNLGEDSTDGQKGECMDMIIEACRAGYVALYHCEDKIPIVVASIEASDIYEEKKKKKKEQP